MLRQPEPQHLQAQPGRKSRAAFVNSYPRQGRSMRPLIMLLQDLRFGLRMLRRHPGFAAAAVTTLALGIGATTAVFSVTSAVILRSLQFPESQRAMVVLGAYDTGVYRPLDSLFVEWRDRQQCFDL